MEEFLVIPKTFFTELAKTSDVRWNKLALSKHKEMLSKSREKQKLQEESDLLREIHNFPDLVSRLPKSSRIKGEKLLYELNARGITWDSKTGEVYFKKKALKNRIFIRDLLRVLTTKTRNIPSHIVKDILLLIERANISKANIINPLIRPRIYSKIPKSWDVY